MITDSNQFIPAIARLSQGISLGFLGLHLYRDCYWLFDHWGWTAPLCDKILKHADDTDLLADPAGRCSVLFFLVLSLLGARVRKDHRINGRGSGVLVIAGLILFLCSPVIFARNGEPVTTCIAYLFVTLSGYVLLMRGGARWLRTLRLPWREDDPFGRQEAGFPQEQRRLESDYSLHLPAQYTWKGKTRDSWINLLNPRRGGILIIGSPGSGKSWLIIEPLIRQLTEKAMSLFVFDFKYDVFTRLTYQCFQENRKRYPPNTAFYSINFSDLSRSHRCNLLEPSTLSWISDALGASRTILLSLNKTWVHKQGEFFVESPINFLAALIWYLRKYENGRYCTLPHVIELAQQPYDELFTILSGEPEVKALIGPFIEAYRNKTFEMLDGQIASARIPLGRLASADLYYILSGDDFSLAINDPAAPKILCLGGDAPRQEALAPVLSLYIDRLSRLCNREGRYPCALVCDEFATVRAYSMAMTIATARSNNIIPILAIQDLSQLRTQYSREEADLFLNITGNFFCGQVGGETARWVSERFPKIQRERPGISTNSHDTTISTSLQWEPTVTPATIAALSAGEFVGMVADDPGREMELKAFHARLVRGKGVTKKIELPMVKAVDADEVRQHFQKIKQDVLYLVSVELERKGSMC